MSENHSRCGKHFQKNSDTLSSLQNGSPNQLYVLSFFKKIFLSSELSISE